MVFVLLLKKDKVLVSVLVLKTMVLVLFPVLVLRNVSCIHYRLLCVLTELTRTELDLFLSPHDLNRLEKYAQNMVDYHMVMDLLPTLARLYFTRWLDISLNELKSVSMNVCF